MVPGRLLSPSTSFSWSASAPATTVAADTPDHRPRVGRRRARRDPGDRDPCSAGAKGSRSAPLTLPCAPSRPGSVPRGVSSTERSSAEDPRDHAPTNAAGEPRLDRCVWRCRSACRPISCASTPPRAALVAAGCPVLPGSNRPKVISRDVAGN
jgi:hypothetical protein